MSKAQYTPGPWELEYDEDQGTFTVWAGNAIEDRHTGMYDAAGEIQLYSSVWPEDGESFEEFRANALLIAAAPELLKVLKRALINATSHREQDVWAMRTAISLAEGEKQ